MPTTARTTRKTTASRAAPRKKAEAAQAEEEAAQAEETQAEEKKTERTEETHVHQGPGGVSVHTRTLHPPVPVAYITRQDLAATARAATSLLPGRPSRPPVKDLAFYGGLGALAVAGALEWPIAAAVGGATWLVRSKGKEKEKEKEERKEGMESQEESGSRTGRPAGRAA